MSDSTIRWERGDDGIVLLTLDDPAQSANTMNAAYAESMGKIVERLQAEKDQIKGVIITSGKKTFFAGGDLNTLRLVNKENAKEFGEFLRIGHDRDSALFGFRFVQADVRNFGVSVGTPRNSQLARALAPEEQCIA